MRYNYSYLENAAKTKARIGTYLGFGVYAGSQLELQFFASETFYVLYDYQNIIIFNGKVFGILREDGSVDKLDAADARLYERALGEKQNKSFERKPKYKAKTKTKTEVESQFEIDLTGLLDQIAAETEKMLDEVCKF